MALPTPINELYFRVNPAVDTQPISPDKYFPHWFAHPKICAAVAYGSGYVLFSRDFFKISYSTLLIKWVPILLQNSKKFWKTSPFYRIPILSRKSCREKHSVFSKRKKENAYYLQQFRCFSENASPFYRIPILSRKSSKPKMAQVPILSNSHFIKSVL